MCIIAHMRKSDCYILKLRIFNFLISKYSRVNLASLFIKVLLPSKVKFIGKFFMLNVVAVNFQQESSEVDGHLSSAK